MPKDRTSRSSSSNRRKPSPYSHDANRKPKPPTLPTGNENELEEVKCPICIDHPHNAVLLQCSSHENGCRPYICDTSSQHSNCLDQFRRSFGPERQLVCPLCRGKINGWTVIKPARTLMNSKNRVCAVETCDFAGNYSQLKKHASREHLNVQTRMVESSQKLKWRRLEEEMEQQNVLSMQTEFYNDDLYDPFVVGVNDFDDGFVDDEFEFL